MTTAELPKVTPVRRSRRSAAPAAAPARPRRPDQPSWLGRTPVAGPRIRLGVLWFLVAVAAATAGRWASAIVWSATAAVGAADLVRVWRDWGGVAEQRGPQRVVAGVLSGLATLAAAIGVGASGAALVLVGVAAVVCTVVLARRAQPSPELPLASVLPVIACAPVVLVVLEGPLAALFLIGAVSMYDAGNFLIGAQARRAWEGPVVGVIGVLAVTFTMAALQAQPFDTATAWVAGAVLAVACPLGQAVLTAFLPARDTLAVRARRIDTYLVAAPLFLAATWVVG